MPADKSQKRLMQKEIPLTNNTNTHEEQRQCQESDFFSIFNTPLSNSYTKSENKNMHDFAYWSTSAYPAFVLWWLHQ